MASDAGGRPRRRLVLVLDPGRRRTLEAQHVLDREALEGRLVVALLQPRVLRGDGIGRLLIEHVYAQARAAGASRVHWLTQESNSNARQLYDRIADRSGFIQYRKLF